MRSRRRGDEHLRHEHAYLLCCVYLSMDGIEVDVRVQGSGVYAVILADSIV